MMKRLLPIALAVGIALAPTPAPAQSPVDLAAMTRIRDEGLNRSKVMETVSYLTDVVGARLTGSASMKTAADWTKAQLAGYGLANARLEPWGPFGRGWSSDYAMVRMVGPRATPIIAIPKAWTPGTNGLVRGKVIAVDRLPASEEELAQHKGKLAGAVLLVGSARELAPLDKPMLHRYTDAELDKIEAFEIPDGPARWDREALKKRFAFQKRLNQFLQDEKVLAVVEGSSWDRGVIRVQGGGSRVAGEPVGVPSVVIAAEHFNRLARLAGRKEPVELELDVRAQFDDANPMQENVIAEIPGTDPKLKDEVVMLGAHLDSWHSATGATDNAAGCAVMMEAVRILQTIGVKPRRTIRIALWSGEEQGLLGSRAYVAEHFGGRPEPTDPAQKALPSYLRDESKEPMTIKPDHKKVSAYFNLDNGTGRIRGIYCQQNAAVVPIFAEWLRPFADLGATRVTMNDTGSTDHIAFDAVGIPGFQFIQDEVEYATEGARGLSHHSNMDVLDRVQRQDLIQASVIVAAFVYNTAMRDELLPRKPMPR